MRRELSDAAVQDQARAFRDYYERGRPLHERGRLGAPLMAQDFDRWAASKDFAPGDLAAIRRALALPATRRRTA